MLNIFADALLIASRLGHLPEDHLPRKEPRRTPREFPREFMEIEGLNAADRIRNFSR
jgi:hypothetical protein